MKLTKLILSILILSHSLSGFASKYVFTVKGNKTYLNKQEILVAGLRRSNVLISEKATDDLIAHLDEYKSYGVNTISVFVMGSRYGNFKGYLEDASLNPVYTKRLAKIIEAADDKGMIILVGCLYWGGSTAKWESWTQKEANLAVANTVKWLSENNYRNVFVDVDNEGMAKRNAGFNNTELVRAAKAVDPTFFIATNNREFPPEEADLGIHFSKQVKDKPYIDSEATPLNAPGGYWVKYSKAPPLENYINIGVYTPEMKADQIQSTKDHFKSGFGYMLASTWLQCVAPHGPNASPGGDGTKENPGIRWWLEALKEMVGPYNPPPKNVFGYYEENDGLLCLEAENYQERYNRRHIPHMPIHFWESNMDKEGFSGNGFVQNLPDHRPEGTEKGPRSPQDQSGPELIWKIKINQSGKYYIWIRGYSIGGESNGCHIVIDDNFIRNASGTNISGFRPHKTWVWENKHEEYAKSPVIEMEEGIHTLHLFGRDDGFRCDQILLTTDKDFIPEGIIAESKFIQKLK